MSKLRKAQIKDILIDIGYTLETIRGSLPPEIDIGQDRHFTHIQNQLWKILTGYIFEEEQKAGRETIKPNDK